MEFYLPAADKGILDEAEKIVRSFDAEYSRFRTGNELSRLNGANGGTIRVSPMMAEMLKAAIKFHDETGGIFDPTVLGSLEAVGYDRDFEAIGKKSGKEAAVDTEKIRRDHDNRARIVDLAIHNNTITAPAGFRFDTGGIGKGYIVDYLARTVFPGQADYLISAGGDLTAKGSRAGGTGWTIGVEDPHAPDQDIFSLNTRGKNAAVATSGRVKRRGVKAGYAWHHIIDPRTGEPAQSDILSVTVITTDTMRADVYAKTVLILGPERGLDFIEQRGDTAGVIFTDRHGIIYSSRMKEYLN